MSFIKAHLGAVQHVSEHSIFFVPKENDSLNLKTIASAPPCHREVLQRNGLLAKVCVTVAFTQAHDAPNPTQAETVTLEGRERLWRQVLTYAGLLSDKDAALTIPAEFDGTPWPFVTEEQLQVCVKLTTARADSAAIHSSQFCVPVLSVQEYVYKQTGVRATMAVLWMPRYTQTLRQWAASGYNAAGHRVPEVLLLALLHQVTIAQLTLRSSGGGVGRIEGGALTAESADGAVVIANRPASKLSLETIFVDQDAAAAQEQGESDWTKEPTFVVAVSTCDDGIAAPLVESVHTSPTAPLPPTPPSLTHSRAQSLLKTESRVKGALQWQMQQLFRTPEECTPRLYPGADVNASKQDTWAMGMIVYLLASGEAFTCVSVTSATVAPNGQSLSAQSRGLRHGRRPGEVPFNDAAMTPDGLWRRLRRDLECRGYSSTLTHVVAQLLSLDPLTRPSLHTVNHLLQDLHRPTPILRFPFALGGFDLLRLPNPQDVSLNPGARRYTFADVCVLCRQSRSGTGVCGRHGADHQTKGVTSPSWSDDDELFPGILARGTNLYMTYLYPLCGSVDVRRRRRQVSHALVGPQATSHGLMSNRNASITAIVPENGNAPLHCGFLFQLFGGFAVYERIREHDKKGHLVYTAVMREVLIPYPCPGLRRHEQSMVKANVQFGGALPWPSCCTETLQKSGRVSRHLPFALAGSNQDVAWFGWVLPGERFPLPNGSHWTAPRDGAFVFWCGAELQPTDRDRYFAVTSVSAATLVTAVPRSALPDTLFRQHVHEEERCGSAVLRRSFGSYSRTASRLNHSVHSSNSASAARRRSSHSVADIVLPSAADEIVEELESDVVLQSAFSRPSSRAQASRMSESTATRALPQRRRRSPSQSRRQSTACAMVTGAVLHKAALAASGLNQDGGTTADMKAPWRSRTKSPQSEKKEREEGKEEDNERVSPNAPRTQHTVLPTLEPATPKNNGNVDHSTLPGKGANTTNGSATFPSQNYDRQTPSAERWQAAADQKPTQAAVPHDTVPREVRVLSPLPTNETTVTLPSGATAAAAPSSNAKQWKQPSALMTATETNSGAPRPPQPPLQPADTPNDNRHAAATNISTTAKVPTSATEVMTATLIVSPRSDRTPQRAVRKLSPRNRPSSSNGRQSKGFLGNGAAVPGAQVEQPGTSSLSTPKGVPLTSAVAALTTLHVCAMWLPPHVIEATYQVLTFWVYTTGEHGCAGPPVRVTTDMASALHTPEGAAYISFLSNDAPLFRRNHLQMRQETFLPLLPHHGFACYSVNGALLGVLALRCTVKDDGANGMGGEFEVDTHPQAPLSGTQVSGRAIYAAYLPESVGDEKNMMRTKVSPVAPLKGGDVEGQTKNERGAANNCLRHSPSFSQGAGLGSRSLWNTPSDAQTLTFTSARHLIGEFTPQDKGDFNLYAEPQPVLPACWMGFDGASGCLMFSDVSQAVWVPYRIGS